VNDAKYGLETVQGGGKGSISRKDVVLGLREDKQARDVVLDPRRRDSGYSLRMAGPASRVTLDCRDPPPIFCSPQ
jgi:hypothetical protein